MINAIIKGFMWLIIKLANILILPIIAIISVAFPDLATAIGYASTYLANCLRYIPVCIDLLMLPRGAIIFLFDFMVIIWGLYIGLRVYNFIFTMYRELKP